MTTKHISIRTCIGTGLKKPKKEMIRLTRKDDDTVVVDLKGKEKGRGANISCDISAFDLAIKKNAIQRALKLNRKLTEEEIEKLRKEFLNAIEEKEFRKGQKNVSIKIDKEDFDNILK